MARNVPISLAAPDVEVDNQDQWIELGRLARANAGFTAVELKAFYVIGLVDDICRSVEWLLRAEDAWPEKYLPAFGVFASGVDLLGRCLTGNQTAEVEGNLAVGFDYLRQPKPKPPAKTLRRPYIESTVVVQTSVAKYTVADLAALRHYAAHGQATTKNILPPIDVNLLAPFPRLIGYAMETYWHGLNTNTEYCYRLGKAKISAYSNRAEPLRDTLKYFSKPGNSAGSLFYRLNWQIARRL